MGSLERRLKILEERPRAGRPDARELHHRLLRESLRRLSLVELHVLGELREANAARGEQSKVELWHHLTDSQRALESEWRKVVTAAWREAIEPDEPIDAQEKERLRMETIDAVCAVPLRGGGSESTD